MFEKVRNSRGSSQFRVGKEFLLGARPLSVLPRFADVARAGGERVRDQNIEGQTTLLFDLSAEEMHRRRGRQALLGKDGFDLALEGGFDPGPDGRGFAHGANMVPL